MSFEQVEVPREALDAAADARKEYGALKAGVDLAEVMLQAAAPHLFALWSERLTSDEAVKASADAYQIGGACGPSKACGHSCATGHEHRTRMGMAAALSSVSGKDDADG